MISVRRLTCWGVILTCFSILALVPGTRCFAQFTTTATISGTVRDPSGAAIPGAKVIATNTGTGTQSTSQTNNDGSFVFSSLQVGIYKVSVSKSGFETQTTTGVTLHPGIVSDVSVTLRIGSVSTEVTVSGAVVQVQTSSSLISSQVSSQQVATLPLNGRNYQSLSALMPGVTNTSPGQSLNQGGFLTSNVMSINGMGHSGTLYTLDGTWNMNTGNMTQTTITPNPDTIQEVRVLQNNYGAQYSLFGSNVVLLETRSGTDTFHGSAFEYLRNDALDARNFFSPKVSPLKQNIFGYTLGGPLYIPRLFNKKKKDIYFFWSQQWVKQHIASAYTAADPTADMRNGLFNTPITDPTTGLPFSQNSSGQYVIPSGRISTDSLAFLNAVAPLPNNPGGGFNNYINNTPAINTQRDDEIKVDYNITSKLRLMAEYLDERQLNGNPRDTFLSSPYETSSDPIQTQNQLAQIRLTQMLSSTMVNTTAIAMNNYVVNLALAGITQRSQIPGFKEVLPFEGGWQSNRLPQLDFIGGYPSIGVPQSLPLDHASDLEDTFSDDWSWLRGNHFIKAGVNLVLGTKRQTAYAFSNGDWAFNGQFTGDPIADYLLGLPSQLFQQSTAVRPYMHYKIVSPYVQDQWKMTKKLTLTAGLRVFYLPFDHAQQGFTAVFDPAKYDPAKAPIVNNSGTITPTANYDPTNGLIYNGINGVPLSFSVDHNWRLGPQFGFAYDVFGDGKTSLRGGYGITYTRVMARCSYSCTKNPPLVQSLTLVTPGFPDAVGGSVAPSGAPSLVSQDLNAYPAAMIQTYSLSLQHQFAGNWLTSIATAGNIGHHVLFESLNRNQPLPDAPYDFNPVINTGTVSTAVFAPYQGYNSISTSASLGNLYWNALEASARHPVGHNMFISVAYTWQHGLADERTTNFFEGSAPQNTYNIAADYGSSQVNAAQVLAISHIWTLPWYKNASGLEGAVLGGWKYSGITSFMSGFSLDPGLSTSHRGLASRPNRISADITGPKTVQQWFNTSAFAAPAPGYFGNSGTGIITGPGLINFDMAFYKTFKITERASAEFRGELFNVFNHTNFAGISTGYGSGNYGAVTSARDPRIVEFALRIHF
jgi:Carboxypeptidase regulatory-like domain/TonB-dependent Receptor Plug Domain